MAAEALNKRLKSIVECSICLDKFDNPKQLTCYHHFCKQCLEGIIEFKEDGSATITCPLRCTDKTVIKANETVNNLSASYELKSMLEVFKSQEEKSESQIPRCTGGNNCSKAVSAHCCDGMLCKSCFTNHRNTATGRLHSRNVNLSFNRREGRVKVMCDEHTSDCTHLCMDNKFLCIYCMNRNEHHKKHAKNTIDDEITLLKEAISYYSNHSENIRQFIKCTRENILASELKLAEVLQKRKNDCLAQYSAFLNKEEKKLKRKFQSICVDHMKQYPEIALEFTQNVEDSGVELTLYKKEILDVIFRYENVSFLNTEIVSISDHYDYQSDDPLGSIQATAGKEVYTRDSPVPTLSCHMKTNNNTQKTGLSPRSANSTTTVDSAGKSFGVHPLGENLHSFVVGDVLCGSANSVPVVPNMLFPSLSSDNQIIHNPSKKLKQAFFDIEIDKILTGRVVMNMFDDIVPATCRNFMELCTYQNDFGYKGNKFHFVDSRRYCIGGDITKGDGSGGRSIYGDNFKPENFIKKHEDKGILSMVNSGGFIKSMFFITTTALPGNDGHTVVFGKVTEETYHVFEKVVAVGGRSRPHKDIVIASCGVL